MDPVNRTILPSSPSDGEPLSEKEELSALKAGLRKVNIFRDYVGVGRAKKACREEDGSDGRLSARSEGCEYVFKSDSIDECVEDETEDKDGFSFRNSFSYGTLAVANCVEGALYLDFREDGDHDNWIINHKASLESSSKVTEEPCSLDPDYALAQQPSFLEKEEIEFSVTTSKGRATVE